MDSGHPSLHEFSFCIQQHLAAEELSWGVLATGAEGRGFSNPAANFPLEKAADHEKILHDLLS